MIVPIGTLATASSLCPFTRWTCFTPYCRDWPNPHSNEIAEECLLRSAQAILQVLDSAKNRITLVSFAVYRIPNIGKALVRAAKRGVRLTVIVNR